MRIRRDRDRDWSRDRDRFDKFTERARKVLSLAQEEAQRFNHNYIGTEHLLLGLIREGEGLGAKVLINLGIRLEDVRRAVEFIIGRGDRTVLGEIGMTPRAKKVMELAVDEARQLNHHYVGTEHILLGLVREGEGIAAGVLQRFGVTLDVARREVARALARPQAQQATTRTNEAEAGAQEPEIGGMTPGNGGPRANVITCRIDDRDLDALDALVEAGIRSTRSDAASWLIHTGIDAQRGLFERVYETVAQIRALRAAAQTMAQSITTGELKTPNAQETPETPEASAPTEAQNEQMENPEKPEEPPEQAASDGK